MKEDTTLAQIDKPRFSARPESPKKFSKIEKIDVSPAIIEAFGSLKARLETDGRRLDDFDIVIAATAITLGYRLVTNNEKHFARIDGLEIDNWAKE